MNLSSSKLRKLIQGVTASIGVFLLCLPLWSQGSAGRILGTVTDQTGGVIAGATVTITDVARGVTRTLTTDQSGAYLAPGMLPGTYTVAVKAANFRPIQRENVLVEVGQDTRVDLTLQPGAQTQTITVTEALPMIQTTNATLGGTVNNTTINELPLNGRNYQNLLSLRPGVEIYPGGGAWTQSTNGLRAHDNVYMVDGINHSDPWLSQSIINAVGFAGDAATILSMDAIQEFRTEQNPRAEYGWKPGSQVNVAIKSGTNSLHGTGFAFGRTDGWDARNFFNTPDQPKQKISLEQFGGTAGGPIIKDKLFWFADYEGQRYNLDAGWISNAPITAAGVTNGYTGPAADVNLIAACQAALTAGKLAPLSANLAGLNTDCTTASNYPGVFPLNSGAAGSASNPNEFPTGLISTNQSDNGMGKIDYHVNDKNTLSGMFFRGEETGIFADSVTEMQPQWRSLLKMDSTAGNVNWTWTPSSTLVNEFRWGYARFHEQFLSADYQVNPVTGYGINTGVTNPAYFGFPDIFIQSIANFELGGGWPKTVGPDGVLQLTDHISLLKGNHSFKFGGDMLYNTSQNNVTSGAKGNFRFADLTSYFEGNMNRARLTVGNALRNMYNYDFALFLQDDWRVRPRLTLNLGVRYEIETVIRERNNLEGNFDPVLGAVQVGNQIPNPYNGDHNNFSPRVGFAWDVFGNGRTVLRGGGNLIYETLTYDAFMALGNLVGLRTVPTGAVLCANGTCSQPTGSIAIAAFTLSGKNPLLGQANSNWQTNPYDPATAPSVFPSVTIACGDGNTPLPAGFPSAGTTPSQCTVPAANYNLKIPYVISWNLGIQHAIGNNMSLDISYVGNHGNKQLQWQDLNAAPQGAGWTPSIVAGCQSNPLAVDSRGDFTCAPDGAAIQAARPYNGQFPYYNFIDQLGNADKSNYNGLQATLTARNYHGLTMTAGYTYSHALDIASDNWGGGSGSGIFTDSNPNAHYGSSTFDIRNRFTLAANYDIPGIKTPGQILEGWSINSIVTLQSGQPWSILDTSNDFSGTGEVNNTGSVGEFWNFYGNPSDFQSVHGLTATNGLDYVPGFIKAGGVPTVNPDLLSTPCYTQAVQNGALAVASVEQLGCYMAPNGGNSFIIPPAFGSFGTEGRHMFRDSGFRNWDLSVTKSWRFKERLTTQFRAEFFNVLNHPEFVNPEGGPAHYQNNDPSTGAGMGCGCNTPDVAATNPVFGSGSNRAIQLGLKLIF
jgi:Carboxypeptidase regulatory-like domain/TonB dependent receptor-like, beta-barrel